ncbi:MAG: cytidine deaminase [Ndongobacter sp.]|nr:cytidine deaminase [Ndongobacter sp.]
MRREALSDSGYRTLVEEAKLSMEQAYVPYSGFRVGAALLDGAGRVWRGCNIESASYTPTNCAERTAIFKAISEGVRDFRAIAIVGRAPHAHELTQDATAPCGVCRQVMAEFCSGDFEIVLCNARDEVEIWTLEEMLPLRFTKESMEQ